MRTDEPGLLASLRVEGYKARVERAVIITVAAFDWNCPQHITPRFTEAEVNARDCSTAGGTPEPAGAGQSGIGSPGQWVAQV